jgi:hypothetical protein
VREHDYEPVRGLPGLLPRGETVLWQGAPDWLSLARRAYLGTPVAAYFLAIMVWRFADHMVVGTPFKTAAIHALWLGLVGVVALAVIGLMAWANARSTVYTITNRRLVIRSGAALTLSINVPFKRVASAEFKPLWGDRGDIHLKIGGGDRFSYLMLWPHIRPWALKNPEPTLRSLPKAQEVAGLLADALQRYEREHGMELASQPAAGPTVSAPKPVRRPSATGVVPAE